MRGALLLLLAGCGRISFDSHEVADLRRDGGFDAADPDGGRGMQDGARVDGDPRDDARSDATTTSDSMPGEDAAADAPIDASDDATLDASEDATTDASTDATEDATPDAAPDADPPPLCPGDVTDGVLLTDPTENHFVPNLATRGNELWMAWQQLPAWQAFMGSVDWAAGTVDAHIASSGSTPIPRVPSMAPLSNGNVVTVWDETSGGPPVNNYFSIQQPDGTYVVPRTLIGPGEHPQVVARPDGFSVAYAEAYTAIVHRARYGLDGTVIDPLETLTSTGVRPVLAFNGFAEGVAWMEASTLVVQTRKPTETDTTTFARSSSAFALAMTTVGSSFAVAFIEGGVRGPMYLATVDETGAPGGVRQIGTETLAFDIGIATSGTTLGIVYGAGPGSSLPPSGDTGIYFVRTGLDGTILEGPELVAPSPTTAQDVDIAWVGSAYVMVWQEQASDYEIRYAVRCRAD